MKAVAALLLVASLTVGDSALAAERAAPAPKTPECLTLNAFKEKGEKMAAALEALAKAEGHDAPKAALPDAFAKVSAGAYHFFMGVYVMNPATPPGLPPGDGVLLATTKGKDGGFLLWTKGDLVCGAPMPAPKELLDMVRKIKDSPEEGDVHL